MNEKYQLPYFDLAGLLFQICAGFSTNALQPRRPRRAGPPSQVRRSGAGNHSAHRSGHRLYRSRFANKSLIGPFKDDLERDLSNTDRYMTGIEQLFKQFGIKDYEGPLGEMKKQIAAYDDFLRTEVMPRTTTDFRQPAELYQYSLETRDKMPVRGAHQPGKDFLSGDPE